AYHDGSGVLDRQEWSNQVDAQYLLPQLDRLLEERDAAAADAGVGVEDIEATPGTNCSLDKAPHVALGAGIALGGQRNAPGLLDGRDRLGHGRRIVEPPARGHLRARTGVHRRDRCRCLRRLRSHAWRSVDLEPALPWQRG